MNQTTNSKERFSQLSDGDELDFSKLSGRSSFIKRILSPRKINEDRKSTVMLSSQNFHNYEVVFTNLQMNNTPRNPLSHL